MHAANLKNAEMLAEVIDQLKIDGIEGRPFIAWTGRLAGAIGVECAADVVYDVQKSLMTVLKRHNAYTVFYNADDDHCVCPIIEYRI